MEIIDKLIKILGLSNIGKVFSDMFDPSKFSAVIDQITSANPINIILITFIPAIIIGILIYLNRNHKQPTWLIVLAILSGIITVSLAYVFNYFAADILGWAKADQTANKIYLNFDAMYGVGLVEESLKMLILFFFIRKNKHCHSPFTGVFYGALIGLSFAIVENLLSGYITNIVRCFTSVPLHMGVGVLMGYYMSLSDLNKDSSNKRFLDYKAIFIPAIIHGTYNGLVANTSATDVLTPIFRLLFIFGFVMAVIGLYLMIYNLVTKMLNFDAIYYSNGTYPEPYDLYTIDDIAKNKVIEGHEYFENRQFINNE